MKEKTRKTLNKLFKKFAFLGALFVPTASDAQTVYQCVPCPEGQSSVAGATRLSDCKNVCDTSLGTLIRDCTSSACSGSLSKGWYRVNIHTVNGSAGSGVSRGSSSTDCHWWGGAYRARTIVNGTSASGGAGGSGTTKTYVFYLSSDGSYNYDPRGGAPRIVINSSGDPQRVFSLTKAGNGSNASERSSTSCYNGGYAECCTTTWYSSNGSRGSDSVSEASGLKYRDSASCSIVGGYTSASGIRIIKIS